MTRRFLIIHGLLLLAMLIPATARADCDPRSLFSNVNVQPYNTIDDIWAGGPIGPGTVPAWGLQVATPESNPLNALIPPEIATIYSDTLAANGGAWPYGCTPFQWIGINSVTMEPVQVGDTSASTAFHLMVDETCLGGPDGLPPDFMSSDPYYSPGYGDRATYSPAMQSGYPDAMLALEQSVSTSLDGYIDGQPVGVYAGNFFFGPDGSIYWVPNDGATASDPPTLGCTVPEYDDPDIEGDGSFGPDPSAVYPTAGVFASVEACTRSTAITAYIVNCTKMVLIQATVRIYSVLYEILQDVIFVIIAFAILVYGFMMTVGGRPNIALSGVLMLVKITVVVFLLENMPDYFLAIFEGMDSLAEYAFNALSLDAIDCSEGEIWVTVDCVIGRIFGTAGYVIQQNMLGILIAFLFSGILGFQIFLLALGMVVLVILSIARAIHMFLMAYAAVAVLLGLLPFFLPLVLFDSLKNRYFHSYIAQLVNFAIQPILVFGALAVFLLAIDYALFSPENPFSVRSIFCISGEWGLQQLFVPNNCHSVPGTSAPIEQSVLQRKSLIAMVLGFDPAQLPIPDLGILDFDVGPYGEAPTTQAEHASGVGYDEVMEIQGTVQYNFGQVYTVSLGNGQDHWVRLAALVEAFAGSFIVCLLFFWLLRQTPTISHHVNMLHVPVDRPLDPDQVASMAKPMADKAGSFVDRNSLSGILSGRR